MKKRSANDKGFSLIELIVAVLIIAIISSGAIVAFGSSWSMKADAAARNVVDAMKQTRAAALGRENVEHVVTGGINTDVYAKVYTKDGTVYIDVCSNKTGYDDDEAVLYNEVISSDNYIIKFIDNDGNVYAEVGSDTVYVYFKKSTGGVASVMKRSSGSVVNNVQRLQISDSTGYDYQDLILVSLSGRCYIDRDTAESGAETGESGGGL